MDGMKNKRQELILEIITTHDVETQDELAALLKERGVVVTQATISRDIKELRLIKALSEKGVYKYAPIEKGDHRSQSALMRIFADTVVQIEPTGHLIVIRTLTGQRQCRRRSAGHLAFAGGMRNHCRR